MYQRATQPVALLLGIFVILGIVGETSNKTDNKDQNIKNDQDRKNKKNDKDRKNDYLYRLKH